MAISVVQTKAVTSAGAHTSVSVTPDSSSTSGNLIVVFVGERPGASMSLSGGGVATWTEWLRYVYNNWGVSVWYGYTSGSSAAVTVSSLGGLRCQVVFAELSGTVSTGDPFDTNYATTGNNWPTGTGLCSFTPDSSVERMLFAAWGINNGTPTTNPNTANGYSANYTLSAAASWVGSKLIASTSGSYGYDVTAGTFKDWGAIHIAVKGAAASGPTIRQALHHIQDGEVVGLQPIGSGGA